MSNNNNNKNLTYGELIDFFSLYNSYVDEVKELEGNLLVEAVELVSKDIKKAFNKYNFSLKRIAVKYALKDNKNQQKLLIEEGHYCYTESGALAVEEDNENLMEEESGIIVPDLEFSSINFEKVNSKLKFGFKKYFIIDEKDSSNS